MWSARWCRPSRRRCGPCAPRCDGCCSFLTAAATTLAPGGLAFVCSDPFGLLQSNVGATPRHLHVDARRRLRFPVERHVADGHRATGSRTLLDQLVLNAKPGKPITQIADGLVVGEIGLADPTFGPRAAHHEATLTVGGH